MSVLDYLKDIFNKPEKYTKFWIAFGGFIVSMLTTYFPDAQWLPPLVALVTAVGVFSFPNVRSK